MSVRLHQQIDLILLRALPTAVGTTLCSRPWWPSTIVVTLAAALLTCSIALFSYAYKSLWYLQHGLKNTVLRLSHHPVH